ncbi:MAG: hypothetical protein LUH14_02405 [Clostridiaceae bacterium]|nr:hypothetical protein [Clostridiaceae bacterium]
MEQDIAIYLSALQDSLRKKWETLQEVLKLTKQQQNLLGQDELDTEAFDSLLNQKGILIRKMQRLDNGFDSVFRKVRDALQQDAGRYRPQILEMQNFIRTITDCSVQIQALEQKNKLAFESFSKKKRNEIRKFNLNNKTVACYRQNMANQHHEWQSYFLDQKK